MLKPGQKINEFATNKGKLITLRIIAENDSENFRSMYNSIIREGDFVMQMKEETKEETAEWVASEINLIKKGKKIQLLALDNDKIIGQCAIIKEKENCRNSHVGSFNISIKNGFREEGIGRELAQTAIALAKENLDLKVLRLVLMEDNKRALALYNRLGFVELGIIPKTVLKNDKYIGQRVMYKEL